MTKHEIDCEQALKQLFVYIDHELGDGELAAMERHLHTCKSCFSRVEFEKRLKEKVGQLREDKASVEASARIRGLLKSF